MKLEKTAGYMRVSHQEQVLHGISLDAQKQKLTEYAQKHGLKIVEWYCDEGVSGRKMIKNRPELQRMLKDAQAKKFDRIIFIKLDRFFRSVAEYHECMKLIDPVIWTATEEKYDLSTANGRAFVNMKLTIAELEADQTGERIKIVNDYKVKTAQALTGTQCQGIGFKVEKKDGVKRVIKNPETKELIMDFINYYLTHQAKRQSVQYINEKYNTQISYNSLIKQLKDTKLYGYYRGNPNYCEPYIDKATFDKLQAIFNKNIKVTSAKNIYLFTGILVCPCCGNNLAGTNSSNRTYKRPSGKVYHYNTPIFNYRCNKHHKDNACSYNKHPNESQIEKQLISNLDQYITDFITDVTVSDNRADYDNEAVNAKIKEIKSEMKNTTTAFRKNRMTEAEYDREYTELEAQLETLEAKLEPVMERDLTIYEELLKSDWKRLYEALNRENKRAFWRKYVKEIHLDLNARVDSIIFF